MNTEMKADALHPVAVRGRSRWGVLLPSAVGVLATAGVVHAEAIDFTGLTSEVVLTSVTTAIMAVAAAKVAPKIAAYGASVVLRFIGGKG